jgi:cation diffusion facilitator CzcD-associated flavoprotein CzcO
MDFWQQQMPQGMLLRSSWHASHIADPRGALSLDKFRMSTGIERVRNLPLNTFIQYGMWFQQSAVPRVDGRRVSTIRAESGGFRVLTEDGDSLQSRRVLIATGLLGHEVRPAEFRHLPSQIASHSCEHADFANFRGREVAVVGRGQSAIESAALLTENGARVEVIARGPHINWLGRPDVRDPRTIEMFRSLANAISPRSEVGPFPWNWLCDTPRLYRIMPAIVEGKATRRALRPAAASWLYPRLKDVVVRTRRNIRSAVPSGSRIRVALDDGTQLCFDHILLATGYRVDVSKIPFLSRPLLDRIETHNGSPVLSAGLESSVPGLYFTGAAAAHSTGPLLRFVSGTGYASRALTSAIRKGGRRI